MKPENKQRFSIRKYTIGTASVLGIDTHFPTVFQTKTTKLEATGQVLEYIETYKRSDFYKIKFISCDRDH